jgi:hypothetical protein
MGTEFIHCIVDFSLFLTTYMAAELFVCRIRLSDELPHGLFSTFRECFAIEPNLGPEILDCSHDLWGFGSNITVL